MKRQRSTEVPRCRKCDTDKDLYVWYVPDEVGYGPGHCHEIICSECPNPGDVFKDGKQKYDPDCHDKIFGIKDYDVPWSYIIICGGGGDVKDTTPEICFECYKEFDARQKHGSEYLPTYDNWRRNPSVSFCQECYRERRRNHTEFNKFEKGVDDTLMCQIEKYFKKRSEMGLGFV